jgi:hypothetical protein
MHDSKLFQLLQKLSPNQWTDLKVWMETSILNSVTDGGKLFNYYFKYRNRLDHPDLLKDQVLSNLQNIEEVSIKKLAYLNNKILQNVEDFLVFENNKAKEFERMLDLGAIYKQLNLELHYKGVVRKIEKSQKDYPLRNRDFLERDYLQKKMAYHHADPNLREFNPALQEVSNALDSFYLAEKLKLLCEMSNFERTLNLAYEKHFEEEINLAIQTPPFNKIIVLKIYAELLTVLSDDRNNKTYQSARIQLQQHRSIFKLDELKWMYDILLNYCTRQIMHFKDETFQKEYFELNKYLLEHGILMENGVLSPWRYSNQVTAALRLGEMEWAKQFVTNFKKHLPEEHAENLYHYKMGQIYYEEGEFTKAQKKLVRVELKDPLLALSVKNLLVKIYFETGETELLVSFLEAYRIYVFRNEILQKEIKNQVRNFIDFTRKMAKTADFEKEKLKKLLLALPPEKEILHKSWIEMHLEKKLNF